MAITRPKPKDQSTSADAFISGAPDAQRPRGVRKGNKQQISLTISPMLLQKVDELAAELGQSRAAIINMAVYRAVEHGLIIDGLGKNVP
ncbi:ribbon-helix-helix domain-containing protein [Acidithiobacillus acidisediminis]|uniref:ribbon-helix-helix domain-containing protein n=1 Tax=Acidithiobacillus acidisediminis TaxID=2937799 RepID=UPI0024B0A162|nr:ribbon-helix-helix domain-containing protein [Acidithiobacillus sp. S30A2]